MWGDVSPTCFTGIYIWLTPHVLLYIIGNYNNHNDTVPVFNGVG